MLTGAPPAFCAGADLTGVESGAFLDTLLAALRGFTDLPIPTIAAIDGPALGAGTQLVISCDLRVATARSVFGIPAARLGLVVDHWTVERLPLSSKDSEAEASRPWYHVVVNYDGSGASAGLKIWINKRSGRADRSQGSPHWFDTHFECA